MSTNKRLEDIRGLKESMRKSLNSVLESMPNDTSDKKKDSIVQFYNVMYRYYLKNLAFSEKTL